ncbi:MAG: DUF4199 domain-containing protein [Muribaculaceae bacterium]|nr:DUF4199 domain-containing protein [Muribaculaceae bacterium]
MGVNKERNLFARGADYGAIMGLWLSAMALSFIYVDKVAPLAIVALVMLTLTPVVVYRYQRREWISSQSKATFSDLWMLGILMFICGSLITGAVTYVVLQWIRPDFIMHQAQMALEIYKSPSLAETQIAPTLESIIKEGLLPTPIQMVMSLFWSTTFMGSLLSALTSAIVRTSKIRRQP